LASTPGRSLKHLLGSAVGDKLSSLAANVDPRGVETRRRASSVGAQSASRESALFTQIDTRMRQTPSAVASVSHTGSPSVQVVLFALSAGDQLVGVDNYSDAPAGPISAIPKVGSNYEPSLERIVALAPDLVITALSANRRETAAALERLGVPVFVTDTKAIPQMDRTLRNLGALTGHGREAEQEVTRLRDGLAAVRARGAGPARPRVLVVVWDDPLYVAGRDTFTDDLVEIAGGTNVAADAVGFATYPLERVLHAAPDVIVLPTHSAPERGARAVAYWSRWPDLPAVRAHRVYAVEDALISRPGARLVAGAELLQGLIRPPRVR